MLLFEFWILLILHHYFFNSNSKWLYMLHSWRKKYVKWTTFDAFLRVNFFLIFFSRRLSFPFKYGKTIFWRSWRLKSQNFPLGVNHAHDTDLSKLVHLCPVKKNSLISTAAFLVRNFLFVLFCFAQFFCISANFRVLIPNITIGFFQFLV